MKEEDKTIKIVKEILEELLSRLGIESENEIVISEGIIFVNIKTQEPGFLIGWHGNTLSALQYILRLLIAEKNKQQDFVPLVVDVESYRQKQKENLERMAVSCALQIKGTDTPYEFSPMSSYKRRIIHLALANFDDVTTESIGEGPERRVVVKPVTAKTQKGAKTQKQEKTAAAPNQKIGSGQTPKDEGQAEMQEKAKTATAKTQKGAKTQKKKSKK